MEEHRRQEEGGGGGGGGMKREREREIWTLSDVTLLDTCVE
jgi:hypothetical protein